MRKVTKISLLLVTFVLNSFFLVGSNGFAILKLKKLCTCSHSESLHLEEEHSKDPSEPHFCPRHTTNQKVESHFIIYPFMIVTATNSILLQYDLLFFLKPYSSKVSKPYPTKFFRPPKV